MFKTIGRVWNKFIEWYENIPRNWRNAYFFICLWYLINYTVSAFFEWKLFKAYDYDIFWNTLYLYEILCLAILLIFLWSKILFQFRVFVQVSGHFFGLLVFTLVMQSLFYYFDYYLDGYDQFEDWQEYMIDLLSWDAMRFYDQYIIVAGVFYLLKYFETIQKKEHEQSELIIKNKEMQLSLLKSQINPHFLFNTLNSISTLIHSSKQKARQVITQLSDVFRYALDSYGGMTVKLESELEFIDNYIRIQQVRFGERLKFEKDIADSCLTIDLPPMILQPLVENAVKYGIAPKDDGGTIVLTIRPYKQGIFFEVRDNGLGINAKKVLDSSSSGVGLDNTSKRLKSYFGSEVDLLIKSSEDGFIVSFLIPAQFKKTKKISAEVYEAIE